MFGSGRIHERRHEQPRAGISHLMHVVENLWMPFLVHAVDRVARLDLGEHVPIAVVIVAGVMVVELRHRRALERRLGDLFVPVDDDIEAVGIERGDEDEDDVVEDRPDFRRVARRHVEGQLHRHLRGANFRGMHRARDGDDRLAFGDQPFGLLRREPAGIGESSGDFLVAIELRQILGRADRDAQKRLHQRCLPDDVDLEPVGRLAEVVEVAGDLLPVGELIVIADAKPEILLGRLDLRGGRQARTDECQQDEERHTHVHSGLAFTRWPTIPFTPSCRRLCGVLKDGRRHDGEHAAPIEHGTHDSDRICGSPSCRRCRSEWHRNGPFVTSRTRCRLASTATNGRTSSSCTLSNRGTPVDGRAFRHRHAELFRASPEWEVRLLVP